MVKDTKKGNSKTSSISKIKKITAIKKNRRETGIRALFFLEKPHSKGLLFCRSISGVFLKIKVKLSTNKDKITATIKRIINFNIK